MSNLEVGYTFDQYDKSDYQSLYKNDVRDYSNVQHNVHALYNYTFNGKHTLTVGADYLRDYLMSYQFTDNADHTITDRKVVFFKVGIVSITTHQNKLGILKVILE